MVWWLFSRKKEEKNIHPHIEKVENALKSSFHNIKTDISAVLSHLSTHEDHIKNIHKRLNQIERDVSYLYTKVESGQDIEIDEEFIKNKTERITNNLTAVQKSILLRLASLQSESSDQWISTKNLTEDLYPEKEYSKVRPMISDYLNILSDFGLINKIRKRRQTYTSITKKGLNLIPKDQQKKIIKLLEKT